MEYKLAHRVATQSFDLSLCNKVSYIIQRAVTDVLGQLCPNVIGHKALTDSQARQPHRQWLALWWVRMDQFSLWVMLVSTLPLECNRLSAAMWPPPLPLTLCVYAYNIKCSVVDM